MSAVHLPVEVIEEYREDLLLDILMGKAHLHLICLKAGPGYLRWIVASTNHQPGICRTGRCVRLDDKLVPNLEGE